MFVHHSPRRHSGRLQNAYEDGTDEDEQHLLHPADRYDRRRSDCGRPSSPQDQHPRHTQLHASSRMFADPQRAAYDVSSGPFSNAPRPAHTAGEGISGTVHAEPAHTCREAALPPSALPSYQSHTRTSGAPGRCNTVSWDTPRLHTPSVHRSKVLTDDRPIPPPGFYYSDSPYPEPARHDGRPRPVSPRRIPSASTSQPAYAASHAEHQHHPQQRTVTTLDSGGGRGLCSSPSEPIDTIIDLERKSAFYRNAAPIKPTPYAWKPLDLPTFDGDIRQYARFREAFNEVYGSHPSLEPRTKLQYLRMHLRGAPLAEAERYSITDVNYANVIRQLDARYGREGWLLFALYQDLFAIKPPTEELHDLRRFCQEVDSIQSSLRYAGETLDNSSTSAIEIAKKLPRSLRLKLVDSYGYQPCSRSTTALLECLDKYVTNLEWASAEFLAAKEPVDEVPTRHSVAVDTSDLRGPPRRQDPEWTTTEPSEYGPRAAAAVATTFADKQLSERRTCPLCGLLHSAADCTVYDTTKKRLRRVQKLKMCILCLREGHPAASCPRRTTHSCKICRHGQHNRALCMVAIDGRQRTVRHPSQVRATKGSNTVPEASDQQRHSRTSAPAGSNRRTAELSVNRDDTNTVPTATTLRQSDTQSSRGNIIGNLMNRKKRPKDLRTDPPGRTGTNRPPTTSTDESMKQNGADAYGSDRLLPGRYDLLQTDRCLTKREMLQLDRGNIDGSEDAEYQYELYGNEDFSHQPSDGHRTDAVWDWQPDAPDETRFSPDEESTAYVACASDSDEQPAVLHECLAVTAMNPASTKSCRAVIMFDSGSCSSHVSSKLARDLDLPHGEMRVQNVSTFGSKTPMAVNGFRTFLVLCSEHGRRLQVHVTALDYIVFSVRTALVRDADLPALRRNDCTPTTTREMPDLLIGQDLVHLFDRRLEPTLPSGFYVVRTSMGLTIGGASRRVTPPPKAIPSSSPPAALPAAEDDDIAEVSSRCSLLSPPSTPDSPISRHHLRLPELSAYRPAHSAGGTAGSAPETSAYRPAHSAGDTATTMDHSAYRPAHTAGDTAVHDTNECLAPSTSTPFTSRQPTPLPQVHGVLPRSSQKQLSSNPLDTQLLLLPTYSTIHIDAEELTPVRNSAGFLRPVQEPLSSKEAAHRRSPLPTPTRGNQICAALRNARSPLKRKTRLRCRLPNHARQTLGIYAAREPVIAVVSLPPSEPLRFRRLLAEQDHQLVLTSSQPPQITIILRISFIPCHHRALCRRCVSSQPNNVHVNGIRQGKKRVKTARVRIEYRNACPPKNETICFCDESTFHQFGRQLRPGVQMIETPTHTSADAASFVCSFRPANDVKRYMREQYQLDLWSYYKADDKLKAPLTTIDAGPAPADATRTLADNDVPTGPCSNAPRPAHTAGEGISGTVHAEPAHTCREAALPSSLRQPTSIFVKKSEEIRSMPKAAASPPLLESQLHRRLRQPSPTRTASSRTLTPCAPSELHLRSRSRHSPRPRPSLMPTPMLLPQPASIANEDPRTAVDVAASKDMLLRTTTSMPSLSDP